MSCGKVLKLFLISCLPVLLSVCKLDVDIPDYLLEFQSIFAYPDAGPVTIKYRFIAEEDVHRCQHFLTSSDSTEIDSGTEFLSAGTWHTYDIDLTGHSDDHLQFRVVVQTENTNGDYIALSFLDKSTDFYIDSSEPVVPTLVPTPTISSRKLGVKISHPECPDTIGSPVSLYYTLNSTDPDSSSDRYTGTPIPLEVSSNVTEIRAIAIDASGNTSPSIASHIYKFVNIDTVDPSTISKAETDQFIEIYGYGFFNANKVKFYDHDLTAVMTSIMSEPDDNDIKIAVNLLNIIEPGDNDVFDTGQGWIVVVDSSLETAEYEVTITD